MIGIKQEGQRKDGGWAETADSRTADERDLGGGQGKRVAGAETMVVMFRPSRHSGLAIKIW